MNKQIRGSLILVLTAFIWGTAFVAQSQGIEKMGPFGFNAVRNFIGVIVLIPVIFSFRKVKKGKSFRLGEEISSIFHDRKLLMGGLLCGIALCVASNFQQVGIKYVSFIGKAGFLTALYIVLVPIAGFVFLKKKVGKLVIIGLLFALCGLYLLCINQTFTFEFADIMLIACAIVFTIQILLVDNYAPQVDPLALACIEFFVNGVLSLIPMFLLENNTFADIKAAALPLLYAGVFSSGVAYTLQMVAQRDMNPTIASLIMSLEAVVSILAGVVILGDRPSSREILGCILMFAAVILAQIPDKVNDTTSTNNT